MYMDGVFLGYGLWKHGMASTWPGWITQEMEYGQAGYGIYK